MYGLSNPLTSWTGFSSALSRLRLWTRWICSFYWPFESGPPAHRAEIRCYADFGKPFLAMCSKMSQK